MTDSFGKINDLGEKKPAISRITKGDVTAFGRTKGHGAPEIKGNPHGFKPGGVRGTPGHTQGLSGQRGKAVGRALQEMITQTSPEKPGGKLPITVVKTVAALKSQYFFCHSRLSFSVKWRGSNVILLFRFSVPLTANPMAVP